MEFLDKIIGIIDSIPSSVLVIVGTVLELGLRLIKSDKPKSILWMVYDGIGKVAGVLGKVAELLDRVLPQRLSNGKK